MLINDVLDYSRIEAERLTLHPEPFDLEAAVHEVVTLLRPSASARPLELLVDFDPAMPGHFIGDLGRIRQVLTNLAGNAVKFTEAGHVLVRVSARPEGKAGNHRVQVTVEDTGIGIPPEMAQHVFGEFNQVEGARNRRFEGTGLGLSIARRLVRLMGGQLWLDSTPGKGSCFGFHLSLRAAEAPGRPPAPDWLRRVLLADPGSAHGRILRDRLAAQGIEVQLCADAAGLRAAGPGDVVLLDEGVAEPPEHLAQGLRADGFAGPILALASGPAPAAGTDTVLQKPLRRDDIFAALAAGPAPVQPVPATPGQRVMRVLAAEDNRANRLVFSRLVREARIDLTFAENGREAVERFRARRPDLLFMDISMPGVDGKEATRRIRAIEAEQGQPPVPIVAMTAHALTGDEREILKAGLDHYLTKPLTKALILDHITAACPPDCQPPVDAPMRAQG